MDIKIGQVWEDSDKRRNRMFQVEALIGNHALCKTLSGGGRKFTKIRLYGDR